jgi:CheY-like chemotaxis protein
MRGWAAVAGEAVSRFDILVVDDDRDLRSILVEVLKDGGYTAVGASGGREALEILGRGPLPALILLDLMMPEMDGYEFRRVQRTHPPIAAVPVVILSAHANVQQAARELHADGYLSKPLGVDALLAAVGRFVPSPS